MLFDNCIIQAPDGVNLSRCGNKKVKWYIQNGLADIVSENPTTIRLRFEPSGRCGLKDPLLMEGKPNICVVCGTEENLNRHHIIPYSFIRYMNLECKVDIIRDIFPCCEECHNDYEKKSTKKREQLAKLFGIPLNGIDPEIMRKVRKATGAAVALYKHKKDIPLSRQNELIDILKKYLEKEEITDADIDTLANHKITNMEEYVCFSEYVANNITDYNDFARDWREHFVQTMNPKYMPKAWKVDRKTENVWVPRRMREQGRRSSKEKCSGEL